MKLKANAKLNLALYITGRRGSFHTLDMLNTAIDLYDEVEIDFDANRASLEIESNLKGFDAVRFSEYFKSKLAHSPLQKYFSNAAIFIKKNIPSGAGLGGGTAALAALAFAAKSRGAKLTSSSLAEISSDLPYMLVGGFKRVGGVGEIIEDTLIKRGMTFLIAKPQGGVSSAEAFALYDSLQKDPSKKNGGEDGIDQLINSLKGDLTPRPYFNALQPAAFKLNSSIAKLVAEMTPQIRSSAFLTGSGSAIAFEVKVQSKTEDYAELFPHAEFVRVVKTRDSGIEV